jgi:16S rRNA (guanine(966)-N(2))-methyltransferase RsmD
MDHHHQQQQDHAMRIIGGEARGRRIEAPQGRATRPTTDRVRESIFSILQSVLDGLEGIRVLDLYAGCGALGLEALSRGAASAVFVDNDSACQRAIKRNAGRLGYDERCVVLHTRVEPALDLLSRKGQLFELVLADPPYAQQPTPLLERVARAGLISSGGVLVLEHGRHQHAVVDPEQISAVGLDLYTSRRYGDTMLSLFTAKA